MHKKTKRPYALKVVDLYVNQKKLALFKMIWHVLGIQPASQVLGANINRIASMLAF